MMIPQSKTLKLIGDIALIHSPREHLGYKWVWKKTGKLCCAFKTMALAEKYAGEQGWSEYTA